MGWKRRVKSSDEEHLELVTVILCLMIQVTKMGYNGACKLSRKHERCSQITIDWSTKKFKLQEGCYTAHF